MPRRTRYAGQDIKTLGGRFEYLLQHGWRGRQREMAADLGVSQGLISKVARGEQTPGPKLIEALADQPKVNARWLLEGVGEPLIALGVAEQQTGGRSLPIATCPLPGSPQVNAGLLSGASFPVAESSFKGSRYFYAAQKADPVVRAGLDVRPGDLLLFETDPAFWRPNIGVLHGKLCVLKLRTGSGAVCVLARTKPLAGRLEPTFEVLGWPYGEEPTSPDREHELIERFGKGSRVIEPPDSQPEPSRFANPTSPSAEEKKPVRPSRDASTGPTVDEVAGLCLLLIRTDVGS